MAYYNDSQTTIEPVEAGDAANDNKGDFLRIAVLKYNTNIKLILDFLTGGSGSDVLNKPLPIARGGTGASSAQTARVNLGLAFFDCNGMLRKAVSSVEVFSDHITVGPYGTTDANCMIMPIALGRYRITGIAAVSKTILPLDSVGKPQCIVEIDSLNAVTKEMEISVYSVKWLNGWVKDALMDLPAELSFNFIAT